MSRIFVDTSAYFAYINPNDTAHDTARRTMTRLADTHASLLTSNFVIAETHALLLTRMSHIAATGFLDAIFASATRIIRVREADETAARELLRHHADKEYSYTDANSFAVMNRLHIHKKRRRKPRPFMAERNAPPAGGTIQLTCVLNCATCVL